ncbi:MAG: porin, partial [Hyphomicrobium sp.]|nr:porin [Hyphomicrobium sp.]
WGDCNGLTQNSVRYDSPTFGGFSVSASWGEDDFWDVAARYAGEFSGFKIAIAGAYNEVDDPDYNNIASGLGGFVPEMEYFQLGLYVQHIPSGLFGLYNFGTLEIAGGPDDINTHYFKGGLRTKFNHLGATVFYGEYLNGQDGGFNADSELDVWGLGVVQEVDAAAMSVWVKFRNQQYEDAVETDVEDFNYVGVGGLINF